MKLISDLLQEITKAFHIGGISDPKRQAEELLCDVLNYSRAQLYSDQKYSLKQLELEKTQDWVQRRLKGEPLAYVSGKVFFYNSLIQVNPSVLIPRPETEVLVDKIVSALKRKDLKGKILWDLCCGSGCIGIALKKALPELSVYLSDYSCKAVDLARINARMNEAEVVCLQGDLFDPFKEKKTHYFVCNPPYVSEDEYEALGMEVKGFEPRLALVAGPTGLEFYERLARDLPHYFYPGGQGWLEIGYQQGEAVKSLFQKPPWKRGEAQNDWAGHNRFFFLEIE